MRILIAAALLAGSSSIAAAQCAPADLAGSWSLIGSQRRDLGHLPDRRSTPRARSRAVAAAAGDHAAAIRSRASSIWPTTARSPGSGRSSASTKQIEGALAEGSGVGSGIVRFGPRRQNLGLHFTLVRTGQ